MMAYLTGLELSSPKSCNELSISATYSDTVYIAGCQHANSIYEILV